MVVREEGEGGECLRVLETEQNAGEGKSGSESERERQKVRERKSERERATRQKREKELQVLLCGAYIIEAYTPVCVQRAF